MNSVDENKSFGCVTMPHFPFVRAVHSNVPTSGWYYTTLKFTNFPKETYPTSLFMTRA